MRSNYQHHQDLGIFGSLKLPTIKFQEEERGIKLFFSKLGVYHLNIFLFTNLIKGGVESLTWVKGNSLGGKFNFRTKVSKWGPIQNLGLSLKLFFVGQFALIIPFKRNFPFWLNSLFFKLGWGKTPEVPHKLTP